MRGELDINILMSITERIFFRKPVRIGIRQIVRLSQLGGMKPIGGGGGGAMMERCRMEGDGREGGG